MPTLSVGAEQLPDLVDSWGWAHVQRADDPGDQVARLLCPRRLRESTRYRACIVPSFTYLTAAKSYSPAWQTVSLHPSICRCTTHGSSGPGCSATSSTWSVGSVRPPRTGSPNLGTVLRRCPATMVDRHTFGWCAGSRPVPRPGRPRAARTRTGSPTRLRSGGHGRLRHQDRRPVQCGCRAGRRAGRRRARRGDAADLRGAPRRRRRTRPRRRRRAPVASAAQPPMPTRIAAGLGAEYIRVNQESLMARALGAGRGDPRGEPQACARPARRERHRGPARQARRQAQSWRGGVVRCTDRIPRPAVGSAGPPLSTAIEVSVMPTAAGSTAFARMVRPEGSSPELLGAIPVRDRTSDLRCRQGARGAVRAVVRGAGRGAGGRPCAVSAAAAPAMTAQRSVSAITDMVRLQAISDVARVSGLHAVADALTASCPASASAPR